jgi:hypothetical protein
MSTTPQRCTVAHVLKHTQILYKLFKSNANASRKS